MKAILSHTGILALAVAIAVSSCSETAVGESVRDLEQRTFTSFFDEGTKTSLASDGSVIWSDTDAIDVFDANEKKYLFDNVVVSQDGHVAQFSGETYPSSTYWGVYPSNEDNFIVSAEPDATFGLEILSSQSAVAGSFSPEANVAVSQVDAQGKFHFRNVGGLLGVTIRNNDITSVKISSSSPMTGVALVELNQGVPVASDVDGDFFVELVGDMSSGSTYYAVVYPGTYQDLTLTYTDKNGRKAAYTNNRALTVGRSQIVNVSDITIADSKWSGSGTSEKAWTLVTNEGELNAGDYIVFACNTQGMTAGKLTESVLDNVKTTFSADKNTIPSLPAETLVYTLAGSPGKWEFVSEGKSLGSTAVKKMALGKGSVTWSLLFSNGIATVANNEASYGRLLYNSSAPRFTTYTSGQTPIQIYRLQGDAEAYVTTGTPASDVTASSVVLSADFRSVEGVPTEAGFRYGLSSDCPLTAKVNVSAYAGTFSAQLNALTPSTTYYYRAYIVDGGKTYYGETRSFITLSASQPPQQGQTRYSWYELPAVGDADGNGVDDNDNTLYYAYHLCAGPEKDAQGNTARNYAVCYSAKHHCPVWVSAPRHKMYVGSAGRTNAYKQDPDIPGTYQYNSKSTGGGCNKGHMLGSAERTSSSATNRQVFYYTNIAPQNSSTFNTGGGAWNNLEDYVDGLVVSDTLYEVVGCYFDRYVDAYGTVSNPKTISFGGRSDVSMPTMFYYALLRTKKGNSGKDVTKCSADELQCAAFVISHAMSKGHKPQAKDMISISELEKITGFTYFPNVPNAPKSTFKASDWGL